MRLFFKRKMLSKDKLRKADFITGLLIALLGLWVVSGALKMPMKESYGGVQNVWYVSPALFPLVIGSVLIILGSILMTIAVRTIGKGQTVELIKSIFNKIFSRYQLNFSSTRFLSIISCFAFYIFMNIPRVDFAIGSILFLFVFIQSFYIDEEKYLVRISLLFFVGSLLFVAYFAFGIAKSMQDSYKYFSDILNIVFILVMVGYTFMLVKGQPEQFRRFKIGLIISFLTPIIVGTIFKYRLLIPLPYEGLTAEFSDFLVYDVFFE